MNSVLVLSAMVVAMTVAGPLWAAERLSFTRDIAPIVYGHCAECHRPEGIGPFSLLNYRDVRQHLTQIADVTARRVMPPWQPQHGSVEFVGDRSLSSDQIGRIHDWIEQGAPEGRAADLPPAPRWSSGWDLGTPDLIVTMPAPYTLAPAGGDVFRTFVLPIPRATARFVKGVEFRAGNARAVHHANLGVDNTGSSLRLDKADPEPGYAGGMVPDANYPPGYMLGWTPGQRARPSPEGMAWRLDPGSSLVVQLHMQPTGKPEPVQVSIGLFFTPDAPVRTPVALRLGSETIDIPAGEPAYRVADQYVLPVDVELLAVQPHAHYLARQMRADVTMPTGETRPLIAIDAWDFRWQDVYRYAAPLRLPRGATITMQYTYDNTAANVRNPFAPPRRIVWGQNTTDEMGDLWLQIVPENARDLAVLNADIARKTHAEDLAAYTKVLETDPLNPLRHDAVAMLYLQEGRGAEAAAHLRESLRLDGQSAPAHYNLGIALSVQRNYPDAALEFEAAIRIDPSHADAHNNLGAMLAVQGRPNEAADQYRRAIALRDDNAQAHNNLARVLSAQKQYAEAVEHFTRSLALQPDSIASLSGLAWLRATAADPLIRRADEAVQLAERAAMLTGRRDASILDTLAAAYASAEQFDRAAETARAAMNVANATGANALWVEIRGRLQLYERHVGFVVR